jgi:hypothetical protein
MFMLIKQYFNSCIRLTARTLDCGDDLATISSSVALGGRSPSRQLADSQRRARGGWLRS